MLCLPGFREIICGDSEYRYPLADYTGSAEVVRTGTNGNDGLGTVSSYTPHPSLPYNSLYFHGTTSSFVELSVDTQYTVSSDWSFTMFVYSKAPHHGTIFDYVYDGPMPQAGVEWSNKIKLELNESHILFTMQGPNGEDYGTAVLGTIFTAEAWVPLSVAHDSSNGDLIIMTLDNEFYKSKDFQNNADDILLPQPGKVKLGEAYDVSNPFEGSIVCFALYDTKVSKSGFDSTLDECVPNNWPTTPTPIGKNTLRERLRTHKAFTKVLVIIKSP